MQTVIIALGKKHDSELSAAITRYETILNTSLKPAWIIADAKARQGSEPNKIKQAEADLILQHIKPDDTVIVLDEHGSQFTSPQLAERIQEARNSSTKRLVFVIGGSYGLGQNVIDRAQFVWSLSKLVFPHQLVRLILIEQLYRAETILQNKNYHH